MEKNEIFPFLLIFKKIGSFSKEMYYISGLKLVQNYAEKRL